MHSSQKRSNLIPACHAESLELQMIRDVQVLPPPSASKPQSFRKKNRNQLAPAVVCSPQNDDDDDDDPNEGNSDLDHAEELQESSIDFLKDKMTKRLYSKVLSQQKELEHEVSQETSLGGSDDSEESYVDEESDYEPNEALLDELDALYADANDEDTQFDHGDRELFEKWIRPSADSGEGVPLTLAEIILKKLDQSKEQSEPRVSTAQSQAPLVFPERVVQVYQKLGLLLSRYKSGKLPKAFKVLPALSNWPDILVLTNPEKWTPHAVYQAARLFASSLKPLQAQLFYESVLLPHVRNNISEQKKLNVYLYDALKKAIYKPSAFYKGIILPLCASGDCSLREAVIVSSVLVKQSIPVLHSAACLLKLTEIEYSGCVSIFIRTLLDKKYSLPQRVVTALVGHFTSFLDDPRPCYLLWHQCLLVFVQRYRKALPGQEKEELRRLCASKRHDHVTPEVLRELQ
ncbi:snoRNA-binding rRNA-processing protein [Mitosporidium daphniae]